MTAAASVKEHCVNSPHREPRLEEMLADSIIKAVMEADGVDPRELETELRQTAALLHATWRISNPPAFARPIFAEGEGSHEVPNRRLERHCVDCRLPWALPLCSQRSDHVEIASIMRQATRFAIASPFLEKKGERMDWHGYFSSPCCAHNRRVGWHRRRPRA